MQRRFLLAVSAMLPMSVACRDGPTTVTVPREDGTAPTPLLQPADPLARVHDLFADPFMRDLSETSGVPRLARAFDEVSAGAARRDILSVSRALTAVRDALPSGDTEDGGNEDHDLAILRDVLELVLHDADRILQPAPLAPESRNDEPHRSQPTGRLEP